MALPKLIRKRRYCCGSKEQKTISEIDPALAMSVAALIEKSRQSKASANLSLRQRLDDVAQNIAFDSLRTR